MFNSVFIIEMNYGAVLRLTNETHKNGKYPSTGSGQASFATIIDMQLVQLITLR
jgi:hypothetical protein